MQRRNLLVLNSGRLEAVGLWHKEGGREGGRTFPIRGIGLHSIQLRCSCEAEALRTAQAVAEECAWITSPPGGSYTSLSPTANVR